MNASSKSMNGKCGRKPEKELIISLFSIFNSNRVGLGKKVIQRLILFDLLSFLFFKFVGFSAFMTLVSWNTILADYELILFS